MRTRLAHPALVGILLLFCFARESFSTVIEIDPNHSITATIREADPGDTLLLQDGLYRECVRVLNYSIVLASTFLLSGDSSHISNTIIQAVVDEEDTASCIVVALPSNDSLSIVGLTLRGGRGTAWNGLAEDSIAGGGIHAIASHVLVDNCNIVNCQAERGGGIAAMAQNVGDGYVCVKNCRLWNCLAENYGGGIFTLRSSANLLSCAVVACSTLTGTPSGGGVSLAGRAVMSSCTLCQCGGLMGAASFETDNSLVENCLFVENGNPWTSQYFGVCHLFTSGIVVTRNCVFGSNSTDDMAVNISGFHQFGVPFFVGNVIESHTMPVRTGMMYIWDCEGDFSYNIIRGIDLGNYGTAIFPQGQIRLHHNVFANNTHDSGAVVNFSNHRTFVVTVDSNYFSNNTGSAIYRESWIPNPPTINARNNWWGHESGPFHPTLNPSGQGDTILINGVEFDPWLASPPDTTRPNAVPTHPEHPLSTWEILNVYPNPFNSTLRIDIAGFARADFSMVLYDILGREQARVHDGQLSGGAFTFQAPGDLPSCVYFLRAKDRVTSATRKVVFLK